jgi:hypothetical protein
MNQDLGTIIRADPRRLRILEIFRVGMGYLKLHLTLHIGDYKGEFRFLEILCTNAVDYVIKPPNPAIIHGGPLIEYYEEHPRLNGPGMQCIPGGDGEQFNPPLKFKLLVLDQSQVIAEKFEILPGPKPAAK